ncbi:hypothetical protein BST47_24875 [Mycolicibacterium tusciae]|uniref:Uncharacterized protein n=2 Tax=Mycolicibacterium tusciae TaxID=75922 RepID=A0A1X0JGX7_9MYCO|nr:hypothetical protein BST47_24875 [Mycolicibacterium tusciae]
MDLMFDSQVLRHRGRDVLPEAVLASISGYYCRATTTSRPMSYLIALVMAILLGALAVRFLTGDDPLWLIATSVVLAGFPIALAMARTVRSAVRLGARTDDLAEQSRLARAVCVDHLVCLACLSGFLVVWLTLAG